LADNISIDGADTVTEHVHLQLLHRRKTFAVTICLGDRQRGLIGIIIDEIADKSEGDIYTMVCFDMTEIITNLLKEKNDEKEN